MNEQLKSDWDPRSAAVLDDQIAAYDAMRQRCPVAHSAYLHWSLFRHQDVLRVLNDHQTFSSAASTYLSVPNGIDPPQHTEYRRIIDPYFSPQRIAAFAPVCREIAANLVQGLPPAGEIELMATFAQDFALQLQSAFLGWPTEMHEPLRQWTRNNQAATLARDRDAMANVALEFDGYIKDLLAVRRAAGPDAPDDITTSLLRERIAERLLGDDEIVSILRNWTVGELAT
ncbi:MAG: cytochrome P450, partial [Oxalobacteraceae bacterium]